MKAYSHRKILVIYPNLIFISLTYICMYIKLYIFELIITEGFLDICWKVILVHKFTLKDNMLKMWVFGVRHEPKQPFEWNYFPLLTGRIVFPNKKRNLGKYSALFLKHFLEKKGIWRTLYKGWYAEYLRKHFSMHIKAWQSNYISSFLLLRS